MPRAVSSSARRLRVFLRASSPALWAILACKLLEACSYMMCSLTLRQYLQDNFGFTDIRAGVAYGIWGLLTTVYGVLLGPIVDKVGVRHSLLTGAAIMAVSRFWLALTLSETVMLLNLYVLLPIGLSLGQPVKMIGVRRYTVGATGGFAWSLVFLTMNVGFAVSGVIVDVFREQFEKKVRYPANATTFEIIRGVNGSSVVVLPDAYNATGTAVATIVRDRRGREWVQSNVPHQGLSVWDQMTSYRWIQFASGIFTCVMFLTALLFVTNEEVVWVKGGGSKKRKEDEEDVVRGLDIATEKDLDALGIGGNGDKPDDDAVEDSGAGHFAMRPFRNRPDASICEMLGALNVRPFWIFALLVCCTMFIRMLYRHLDVTFPEYAEREMGDNVKLGTIVMTNPVAVILFTALVALFASSLPLMPTMIMGMTVMSLGCAWLFVHPTFWTAVAFSVTLALGEAFWAPRFLELSIGISAPDGQEGLFTALVNAPMFLVKFFAGFFSGYLLDRYCPETGPRNSSFMWLLIFLSSAVSPVLVAVMHYGCNMWAPLFQRVQSVDEKKIAEEEAAVRWMRKGEYGEDEDGAEAREPLLLAEGDREEEA